MLGLRRSEAAVLVALWAVAHLGVAVAQGPTSPLAGNLVDPDAFMRLVKIESWLAHYHDLGGGWYDALIARDNAPFGLTLHWTRPFDLLVLIGAVPLLVFGIGMHAALFVAGAAISPLLHLVALFALIWAGSPLLPRDARPLTGLLFIAEPAVFSHFMAGRADHHSLIALLFILLLGAMIRVLQTPGDRRAPLLAGLYTGLGLWVSEEALLSLALAYATLLLCWLRRGGREAQAGRRLSFSLLATVMLAVALERHPADWGSLDLDRISAVHVALALVATLFWSALSWRTAAASLSRRLLFGLGTGLAALALMAAFDWRFFLGPMADMDPRIAPIWLAGVAEARSLLHTDRASLGRLVIYLGPPLVGLLALAHQLTRRRPDPAAVTYLGLNIVAYMGLATQELRFAVPAEIVSLVPLSLLVDQLMQRAAERFTPAAAALVRVAAVLMAAVGATGLGLLIIGQGGGAGVITVASPVSCPLQPLSALLNDPHGLGSTPKTILAFLDDGPELLYRTPHRTIGSPYHRNGSGIYDAWHALATADDTEALAIMQARQVDLVLLCPSPPEQSYFEQANGAQSLYARILAGKAPDWLVPLPLVGTLASFRLYAVVR